MKATDQGKNLAKLKLLSLVLLIAQSASLVLCMRQSRRTEGPRYASSSAVVLAELLKLVLCFGVLGFQSLRTVNTSPIPWHRRIMTWVVSLSTGRELAALALVGGLYAIQNNLLYLALTHLPAAIYQVIYQLKVLTTAAFSVGLLGKRLSLVQWMSLLLLAVGVAVVQLALEATAVASVTSSASAAAGAAAAGVAGVPDNDATTWSSASLGFIAVLIASCTSGFAGVLFELVLKRSNTTLWERNIQLGVFGALFSFVYMFFYPNEGDFFAGFNGLVWVIVVLQATGGLLIALVVSYTDNIIKAFATSVSILISALLSNFIGDIALGILFYIGAAIVIVATYLYSEYRPAEPSTVLPK